MDAFASAASSLITELVVYQWPTPAFTGVGRTFVSRSVHFFFLLLLTKFDDYLTGSVRIVREHLLFEDYVKDLVRIVREQLPYED